MKNHFRSVPVLLSGVAALVLSAGAFAAPPQDQDTMGKQSANPAMQQSATTSAAQTKFDLLDANHDGSIDKQEAAVSKALTAQFGKIDANSDGKLSLTEFATVRDLASIKIDNTKGGY